MPIKKGPISASVWQVLAVSLKWAGYFPRRGVGGNAFDFLRLLQNEPETAKAVEAIYRETGWPQAELYSVTSGKKKHRFVVGSETRGSNTKELFYPAQIDGELENALLLNAILMAKENLFSYLWRQEGGGVLTFCYPPCGLFIAAFGWLLSGTVRPDSPAPLAGTVASLLIAAMGVGVFIYPWAYAWWKRHQLRQALKEVATDAMKQAVTHVRDVLQSRRAKA